MYRFLIILFLILITSCARAEISHTPRSTIALTPILLTNTPEPTVTYTASPTIALATVEAAPDDTPTQEPTDTPTITIVPTPMRTLTMFVTLMRTPTPTVAPVPPPVEPAYDPVSLAWFYVQPSNSVPCSQIAQNFNFFILTKGRETCKNQVESFGHDAGLMYVRADGWQDRDAVFGNPQASCVTAPFQNNVAWRLGEACNIRNEHQDFALRRPDGSFIRTGDGFIMADPGNLAWRAYFIEHVMEMMAIGGWTGVFLDNISASRNNVGLPLRDYPDDQTYQDAIADFLATIRLAFDNRRVYANAIRQTTTDVWDRYCEYLDGVMDESFALNWSSGYLSVTQWRNQLDRIEQTAARGVQIVLVSQGTRNDLERQQFALASYLLITAPGIHWRYSQDGLYTELWLYENYLIARQLGRPMGIRVQSGSVSRRNFERGYVEVNPSTHQVQIVLNP